MMTRDTIEAYFGELSRGGEWQVYLAEGMCFVSHGFPNKQVAGREAYVESTKRFYSMIADVELRQLIVDGNRACAVGRYRLQPPGREPFTCDVAELFSVKDGRIDSLEIYFDSAPFQV
jgi:ketosteroid isomerase-like protein